MVAQSLVAWVCSVVILVVLLGIVVFEVLKRWRVGLRLASLDEGLLQDDGVSIDTITDAPQGSQVIVGQIPAVLITDDERR
ncbi:MAG: hypothetical protein QF760_01655 [Candidatus Thalassarchaeaceae archaeon]|jgi:hypothetical protein|nr:hypothetical protein [Candidatus Thalassarchaeaceae archaeon]MDP6703218.1 hypothetical protein [Candidatus Thalassarchaeaceae archaeon]MDP7003989.1 hypothetical protein [Candidatus Thalassarchaeaceae archaeon]